MFECVCLLCVFVLMWRVCTWLCSVFCVCVVNVFGSVCMCLCGISGITETLEALRISVRLWPI